MNERYEYEGEPLNRLIVRAILRKCLVDTDVHRAINPQQVSLTVLEWKENISQYHQRKRGITSKFRNFRVEWENGKCVWRKISGGICCFFLIFRFKWC